jgi:flagellar basal body-associated protein FliL
MSGTTIAIVYSLLGLGSTGVGALKSTNELKAFAEKYGNTSLYSLLGVVTVLFPVALALGTLMYFGKNQQAKKKNAIQELVEIVKPAEPVEEEKKD